MTGFEFSGNGSIKVDIPQKHKNSIVPGIFRKSLLISFN